MTPPVAPKAALTRHATAGVAAPPVATIAIAPPSKASPVKTPFQLNNPYGSIFVTGLFSQYANEFEPSSPCPVLAYPSAFMNLQISGS